MNRWVEGAHRANLLKRLSSWPLKLLLGGQMAHTRVDPTPKNEGVTLLQLYIGLGYLF